MDNLVEIPKKSVKVRQKDTTYIYWIVEKRYNKEKKYNEDLRRGIGKAVSDTMMIPNTNYYKYVPGAGTTDETPEKSDALKIGTVVVLEKFLNDSNLSRILKKVFGSSASSILDYGVYRLVTNGSVTPEEYAFEHPLFNSELRVPELKGKDIARFFELWNITETDADTVVQLTVQKLNDALKIAVASRLEDGAPLYYAIYDGAKTESAILEQMAERGAAYQYDKFVATLNEEPTSTVLVKNLMKKGLKCVVKVSPEAPLAKEGFLAVRGKDGKVLRSYSEKALTTELDSKGKLNHLHTFYNKEREKAEKNHTLFLKEWNLAEEVQEADTASAQARLGCFALLSSEDLKAEEALEQYRAGLMTSFHAVDETTDTTLFGDFLAGIFRSMIDARMAKKSTVPEDSVTEKIGELERLFVTRTRENQYALLYGLTDEQKKQFETYNIDRAYTQEFIKRINRDLGLSE